MAAISELIREEADGGLSFGDYTLDAKKKVEDFPYGGASYKVKTFREITKLERNGEFVYESVPGTAVAGLKAAEDRVSFTVEGTEDAQITLELSPETEYRVTVGGKDAGTIKTNLGGKLSFGVELGDASVSVSVERA